CTLLLHVPGSSPGRCRCVLGGHQGLWFRHKFLTYEVSLESLGFETLGFSELTGSVLDDG
ncbi:hypothetical protein A2U01_0106728, partial [Trifolium medium]|nr:hypothetical protein [Trifolium medium]